MTGNGGLKFKEKSYVKFEDKGFSIYIQTDKGVYKPGQTGNKFNFKVLSIKVLLDEAPSAKLNVRLVRSCY